MGDFKEKKSNLVFPHYRVLLGAGYEQFAICPRQSHLCPYSYSQFLHFYQKLLSAELRAFQICWASWIYSFTLKWIFKYDDGRVEIELLFLAYSKKLNKGPQ